ncbi:MAG: hypothetical protein V4547_17865 [Bacteroidota bacterium]
MEKQFYSELNDYIKADDIAGANTVVMSELGKILAQDRDSFITLLRYADLPASEQNSDAELIETFVNHVPTNRKLLIGSSFLVNHANKEVGFDGQSVISDEGVKSVHKTMYNHFNAGEIEMDEHSNAEGDSTTKNITRGGYGNALFGAIQQGTQLAGNIVDKQHNKKFGTQDLLLKQQNAKVDMAQAAAEQRKIQQVSKSKEKTDKEKTKRQLIIGASVVGGLALLGLILFLTRKKS